MSKQNQEMSSKITWKDAWLEMKKVCYIAGPMIAVCISQFMLQNISIMIVGHLGDNLTLSSSALAVSIANVSGFSFLLGMASALETLCGQAFGAGQFDKVGSLTYTAILCMIILCIPISILWTFMSKLLILLRQDPLIAEEAGKFLIWLLPGLFAYAPLQALVRFFQMQSMIRPLIMSSVATICFHLPVCWVLVFKTRFRASGAALAMGLSFWLNAALLMVFMKFSPGCKKTRSPISMEIFRVKGFLRVGIPSALMICLAWWSYELLILMSGRLPNPQLETSVLAVWLADMLKFPLKSLNTITTLYTIPFGLSAGISTRVSNELGAGNPRQAKVSIIAGSLLSGIEMIILAATLYACRHFFGYVFSNEGSVVHLVAKMTPLLCLHVVMDGIQSTLSGFARGSGLQHVIVYSVLVAYYLFGIPLGAVLGFRLKLRVMGLWTGILSGAALQNIILAITTSRTNWSRQVIKARERVLEETIPDAEMVNQEARETKEEITLSSGPRRGEKG